jgi:hypothetical protein
MLVRCADSHAKASSMAPSALWRRRRSAFRHIKTPTPEDHLPRKLPLYSLAERGSRAKTAWGVDVVGGVYSVRGDVAPLKEMSSGLAASNEGYLLGDEAPNIVRGADGRASRAGFGGIGGRAPTTSTSSVSEHSPKAHRWRSPPGRLLSVLRPVGAREPCRFSPPLARSYVFTTAFKASAAMIEGVRERAPQMIGRDALPARAL